MSGPAIGAVGLTANDTSAQIVTPAAAMSAPMTMREATSVDGCRP
jgi:hypothetical protein